MSRRLSISEIGKAKKHPILKGLPTSLKDAARYAEVEQRLRAAVYTDHRHKTVKAYAQCKHCNAKLVKRQTLLKEYGFKSHAQYLEWKRICSIIIAQQDIQLT